MPESPETVVQVTLSRDAALVLFEMLAAQSDRSEIVIRDTAEQAAIWTLEGVLEALLVDVIQPDFAQLVAQAKARLQR